jgi:hypothetical protein
MEEKKVRMIKTSISHPLRIDEVKVPNGSGIIGMTLWSYINSLLCSSSKEDIDAWIDDTGDETLAKIRKGPFVIRIKRPVFT